MNPLGKKKKKKLETNAIKPYEKSNNINACMTRAFSTNTAKVFKTSNLVLQTMIKRVSLPASTFAFLELQDVSTNIGLHSPKH